MSKLDKSWIEQADVKSEETWDNIYYWGYIAGASDFQEQALKELNKCEGSKIYGEYVLPKEFVVKLIQNLKTNE